MRSLTSNLAYADDLSMEQARDLYFRANGFSLSDYQAPAVAIKAFGLTLKFPNIEARRRVVPLHDLHHVLTEYGTDWTGEAEIGVWELRAGCRSWVAYLLNGGGVIIGMFIAPRRLIKAFRAAKEQRTLYLDRRPYEGLLQMKVGELRKQLGIYPRQEPVK